MNAKPRRLRHILRSFRPSDANDAVAMEFDRQLDAWATGTPAPTPTTSRSSDEHARLAGLTSAFQQVAAMDATMRERKETSTEHVKKIIWEDIMSAIAPEISPNESFAPRGTHDLRHHVASGITRTHNQLGRNRLGLRRLLPTLSPVLNVAMVAIMLLTLGLGTFVITGGNDRWGNGSNGDDPGNPNGLASLPANVQGTPIAGGSLPTADECTVAPLTVDEVMDRIDGPFPGESGYPVKEVRLLATPLSATSPEGAPPTVATIDQIAIVHRELMACIIKGDMFQIWTFFAPTSEYWKNILQFYPRFVDEATVRADLEKVAAGEQVRQLKDNLGFVGLRFQVPLVNPDPSASKMTIDSETDQGRMQSVAVAMLYYRTDDPTAAPSNIPISEYVTPWIYEWEQESESWKVSLPGVEMNRG